jgi:hypothetical protein
MREPPGRSAGSEFLSHEQAFDTVFASIAELILVVAANAHEGPAYSRREDAVYFTTSTAIWASAVGCLTDSNSPTYSQEESDHVDD